MWDLIVSVPDHCLSFYFSANRRILFVTYQCLEDGIIPVFSHGRENRPHIVAYVVEMFSKMCTFRGTEPSPDN